MQVHFDYVDHSGVPFTEEELHALAQETLAASRAGEVLKGKIVELSCAIIDDTEMHRINKEIRGKDDTTDVLSIGEYSDDRDIASEEMSEIFLGELLLSWEDIQNNATMQETTPGYEFAYVFTHGILHLLGYTHGDEMFSLQKSLSEVFINNRTT